MQRVLVTGSSGSGKSTLARTLSSRWGLPYTELDALFHGPGWVPRPEFLSDVRRLVAGERWITEWQYSDAREHLLERADTLIWLDFSRWTVTHRVLRRSMRRAAWGEPAANGNTEGFRAWLDPEHPIQWSWSQHHVQALRVHAATRARPELTVIRLRSPAAVRRWLRSAALPGPAR